MKIRKVIMVALATTMLVAKASTVHASSWRVNNDATKKAHFVDINAAMASEEVHDGDTLYLDPGCSITTTQTVTKQVFIIGTGWSYEKDYGQVTFEKDIFLKSDNCFVSGIVFNSTIWIEAKYVTIQSSKTLYIKAADDTSLESNNATIRNCIITQQIDGNRGTNSLYWTIENCIIFGSFNGWTNNHDGVIYNLENAIIRNNVIYNTLGGSFYNKNLSKVINSTIIDNIVVRNDLTHSKLLSECDNSVITNNVLSCPEDAYSNYPNNKFLNTQDYSSLFVMEGTEEEQFRLTADSPAKGYATDGGDCGIFGGAYPYVAGGLPYGHPYYTRAVVGSTAHDGKLNVSLKVKMQDE